MPSNLSEEETAALRKLMSTQGIHHGTNEESNVPAISRLVQEGYLTEFPSTRQGEGQHPELQVSDKALREYPEFLENGPFGRYGGNYDGLRLGNQYLDAEGVKALGSVRRITGGARGVSLRR
ncbi:hypothetical protein [Streptomyces bauhiniae]